MLSLFNCLDSSLFSFSFSVMYLTFWSFRTEYSGYQERGIITSLLCYVPHDNRKLLREHWHKKQKSYDSCPQGTKLLPAN